MSPRKGRQYDHPGGHGKSLGANRKTQLDEMIEKEVISPVVTPTLWASQLLVTPEKNGDIRTCLDPGNGMVMVTQFQ